jgi:hypothetical protein
MSDKRDGEIVGAWGLAVARARDLRFTLTADSGGFYIATGSDERGERGVGFHDVDSVNGYLMGFADGMAAKKKKARK